MRIRFLPDHPRRTRHFMRVALQRLGWPLVRDRWPSVDLGFKWRDATRVATPPYLARLSRRVPVLNLEASNIGKGHVHEVHARVFGRPLGLDPFAHRGLAVQKSDENYRHDGLIVQCPIDTPANGQVYAKLIDNSRDPAGRAHPELVFDLRTPVFRGIGIPYVLVKYKLREARFAAGSASAPPDGIRYEILRPEEVFTTDERAGLEIFCAEMGLDVCELDVLRDADDGELYVVDVNWTPAPPTRTLSSPDRNRVIDAWAGALEACVKHRVAGHTPTPRRPSALARRDPAANA